MISNNPFIVYNAIKCYSFNIKFITNVIMEKNNLIRQFASRLRDTMIARGHYSSRSTSGVDIHKLVEMTGNSSQICRKYLAAQVIPEPTTLACLAEKLDVSPGWLLFGDAQQTPATDTISISESLLHYIIVNAKSLYTADSKPEVIADFLLGLIQDIGLIGANEEQSKKIIDLALSSVTHFVGEKDEG